MGGVFGKGVLGDAGGCICDSGVCGDILVYEVYNMIEIGLLYVGCTATLFYDFMRLWNIIV